MELVMNVSPTVGKYTYAEYAALLANAGFRAMDFMLNDLVYDTSPMSSDGYKEYTQSILNIAKDNKMKILQTHAPFTFGNWANKDHFENVIMPRTIRSLEMSAMLGAEVAVVHPLHYYEYHGHEEEMFNLNMEFYRALIPYCKEYGIKVGVENMWQKDVKRRYITHDACSHPTEFVRYIDTLDSEYMVACLDVGHIGLPAQDEEAQDAIRILGHDRLHALHIHDNDYQNDQHTLPYQGKMNWQEITKALGEIDYQGHFTYEINSNMISTADEGYAPIAAEFMAKVGYYLISEVERNRKKVQSK